MRTLKLTETQVNRIVKLLEKRLEDLETHFDLVGSFTGMRVLERG